jgi:O-acetylhomoserine (thiol)-lyase
MRQMGFTTNNLHGDRHNRNQRLVAGPEHGALHKPVHHSVAYGFADSRELVKVFQGAAGFSYARQSNPTVEALELKITQMEEGHSTIAFSTGMAALGACFTSLLREGDHLIASKYLFGNTTSMLGTLNRMGIAISFADPTCTSDMESALQPNTKMVLVETIANPGTQIPDWDFLGNWCKAKQLILLVDSTLTSPYLFTPKTVGASLVVHSLTKYIGGHGNALGGALVDCGNFDWEHYPNIAEAYKQGNAQGWGLNQVRKKGLRDFGASLAPESAFHISCGSDTLALRMERNTQNALALAEFLSTHPRVKHVNYPGLASHPQFEMSQKYYKKPGALLSFVLKDGLDCCEFLNQLKYVVSSTNLGDNRTLGIAVAQTIYWEMGQKKRAEAGIDENLIRISVGIEDTKDLLQDFKKALDLA